jgi:mono/diheme cytochrome c family protein
MEEKMKTRALLLLLLIIGVILILSACSPSAAPADTSSSSAPAASNSTSLDGKALVESRCIVCHALDRISSKSKTETEWTATVERMIGHGAQLTDSEKAAVIAYLAATYK